MRAVPSSLPGWAIGAQSAANTGEGLQKQALREQALAQRGQEEQRRQQQYQFAVQQAQQKFQAEEAERQAQLGQAQDALGQQRDQLFAEMQGGPATVQQDEKLRQLEGIAKNLTPENAEQLIGEFEKMELRDKTTQAFQSVGQEVMSQVEGGAIEDPKTQQELQALQQQADQFAQMTGAGAFDRTPQQAARMIEGVMEKKDQILNEHVDRKSKQMDIEKSVQTFDARLAQVAPGSPKFQRLSRIREEVVLGRMTPKEAGKMLVASEFDLTDKDMEEAKEMAFRQALEEGGFLGPIQAAAKQAMGSAPQGPDTSGLQQVLASGDRDGFIRMSEEMGLSVEEIRELISGAR